jgi:AraC-like DNA-binding protein
MSVEHRVIDGRAAPPAHGALSDRIERFAFTQPARGTIAWSTARLAGTVVSSVRSSGHVISVEAARNATLLAPLNCTVIVETARQRLQAGPGGAIVVGTGARTTIVRGLGGQPAIGIGFAVAPRAGWQRPQEQAIPSVKDHQAARALVGFGQYLMDEAGQHEHRIGQPRWSEAAAVLIGEAIADLCDLEAPTDAAAPRDTARRVREAEAFMKAHADEPLTVEAVAAAVGLGPRALQMAFREHRGTTPRARLGALRLERARARLLAADAATTVSGAAFDSGFAHLGRFSVAYRERFGESPSETLRLALTGR